MFNEKSSNSLLKTAFAAPLANAGDSDTAMLESSKDKQNQEEKKANKKPLDDAIFEAVQQKNKQDERGTAASTVIGWANGSEPTSSDFDDLALGLAGIEDDEGDDEITDAQIDSYNYWLDLLADAAVSLGADQADVTAMIDEDDDDAAINVADGITGNVEDEDEAIAVYSVSGNDDAMLEANIKVVRAGQVILKKKRPRKLRQTAKQRAALKKNRLRSHTASAKMSFRKSMKVRKKRGL
ncbi:hypothetical protein O3W44_22270 [Pantoea sp. LMR881]|uniref:hypothetical protein n=1 Tax=Pantoea sp. LMR881 TaxID=3014336 RepID=UPI0022AF7135|nr:hypothetical protein [Pantoea sp. LMR881]MCZ4061259.1 hypothetical protein [Pantoea sp. LMR881]